MNPQLLPAIQAIVFVVMLVGLSGLIIPVIPGLVIIWLAALGYGLVAGFGWLGWAAFALITVLMIAGSFVDEVLMNANARGRGASWFSLGVGLLAGVAGSVLLPPFGGIPLALAAVFLVEFARLKDWRQALHLTRGMAVGCGWAFVIRFLMGLVMIGLWLAWALIRV